MPNRRWRVFVTEAADVLHAIWPAYLAAGALILCGFQWSLVGNGMSFQSDENAAVLAVAGLHWPRFDPRVYNWGTGLFYQAFALKSVLTLGGTFELPRHHMFLLGRSVSLFSAFGALTATYLIGRRLLDKRAARLGACLLAVLPGFVVNAHYFKTDLPMLCWALLAFLAAIRLIDTGARRDLIWLGLLTGYAASIKYSAATLVPAGLVAILLTGRLERLRALVVYGVCVFVGFLLGEPRVWIDRHELVNALQLVASVNRDASGLAASRPPALIDYPWHVFPLAMTWPVLIGAAAGVVVAWRSGRRAWLAVLAFAAAHLALLSADNERLVRYAVPMLPWSALLAAGLLGALWTTRPTVRWAAAAAGAATVAYAAVFSLSYVRAMSGSDPRVEALAWIQAHVPADLPVPVISGRSPTRPQLESAGYRVLEVHDAAVLANAASDYVVESELPLRLDEEDLSRHPAVLRLESYVADHYAEVASFEHSQRLFGIDSKAGRHLAPDWILPNPRITILRRTILRVP